jgi:glycerol-3-phosphate dehydrogenase (NAD(P)+)
VKTALNEMTMVAEGYFASAMMPYLPEVQRTHLPIAETAYQVLHKGVPARKAMKNLENLLA